MKRCEISGKGMQFGHNVSHAMNSTNRVWKPNLQPATILVNGQSLKVKVCTKILKTVKGATEVETMRVLKANADTLSPRIQKVLAK